MELDGSGAQGKGTAGLDGKEREGSEAERIAKDSMDAERIWAEIRGIGRDGWMNG